MIKKAKISQNRPDYAETQKLLPAAFVRSTHLRERERERERDRERQRETETETETDRETEIQRYRDRETETETDRLTDRQTVRADSYKEWVTRKVRVPLLIHVSTLRYLSLLLLPLRIRLYLYFLPLAIRLSVVSLLLLPWTIGSSLYFFSHGQPGHVSTSFTTDNLSTSFTMDSQVVCVRLPRATRSCVYVSVRGAISWTPQWTLSPNRAKGPD